MPMPLDSRHVHVSMDCKLVTADALIEKVKGLVEHECGDSGRRWIDVHADSYGDGTYRIRLLVLEGSPCRGYIVVNYATGMVRAYNVFDKRICTLNFQRALLKER